MGAVGCGRTLAAGAVAAGVILGLCACSTATGPSGSANPSAGPSGAPTIEQAVAPSASPSPSHSGYVNPGTLDYPAETAANYVYSDKPQSKSEEFIKDTYPDLWAQGVRALSPKMVPGYNFADPPAPGAVVQYINGVRYEGTNSEPLGFRGKTADPQALPSDTVANVITAVNGRGAWPAGNVGQGGYLVAINEKDPKGTALGVYQFINASTTKRLGVKYFDGWESAWAYAQTHGYAVPGMDRELNPGEVASVQVLRAPHHSADMTLWVFDSSTNDWVFAAGPK